jgi:hypothetical protein
MSIFATARCGRKDGLAARTGVSADEPFDVDGRLRDEPFQRFDEAHVVHPSLDAELLLGNRLALTLGRDADHLLLGR